MLTCTSWKESTVFSDHAPGKPYVKDHFIASLLLCRGPWTMAGSEYAPFWVSAIELSFWPSEISCLIHECASLELFSDIMSKWGGVLAFGVSRTTTVQATSAYRFRFNHGDEWYHQQLWCIMGNYDCISWSTVLAKTCMEWGEIIMYSTDLLSQRSIMQT